MIDWQPIETVPEKERVLVSLFWNCSPPPYDYTYMVVIKTESGYYEYGGTEALHISPCHWAKLTSPNP